MAEKYLVRGEESAATYEIEHDEAGIRVRSEGSDEWVRAELQKVGDSKLYLLMIEDRPVELYLERRRGGAVATIGRHTLDLDVERWRPQAAARAAEQVASGAKKVIAPMTGSIIEVRVQPGDHVEQGDVVLVIESMKMNNELRSPVRGTVEQTPASAGQRVNAGDVLVVLRVG